MQQSSLCPAHARKAPSSARQPAEDGTYHGTKLRVKKSKIPAYNAELAAKRLEGPYAEARLANKYGHTSPAAPRGACDDHSIIWLGRTVWQTSPTV